ncbi:hypothetical protein EVAR_33686_1 [Eumeta japonica]|uniref:Uncharacterized protein n=1 Tax=Eumeta variegata TaxID=151549 RepID=A0A4C1VNK6_EUMVA|nr:hypothetical protein EVAR_33686_1 [Eumeta japonica]
MEFFPDFTFTITLAFTHDAARMEIERIISSFTSTDHAVDLGPSVVPSFDFSPGSAFDSESASDLESGSVQNMYIIHLRLRARRHTKRHLIFLHLS